ncbi:hypothetical protein [Couchioplanes caeruleus]|uniref:Recombinase A n=2 Tax=Couchioplanes caeruleus TaxID=56438 RepID=A0A1K0GL25_9ACTN|nr:hypothetical protein [Couchioplanes caeruleus]OJF12998.1 hypothetical protein BG844_17655 [Couchioplanes caeruleus subsp. caeruleus]ROP33614.1 hypothetical protein EDD30_6630 [Couchioplanes caeruleus]
MAHQLVQTVDEAALEAPDASRVLPVLPELAAGPLPWPGGIRRGATVSVRGSTSLVLALLSDAMRQGAWAAVCGLPTLGLLAAEQDYYLDLARLALVPSPGPDWPSVVSALIDGFDVVVVAAPGQVTDGTARSLMARARQKDCVLLPVGAPWPGSDLAIEVTARAWTGLGAGRGRLKRQRLTVRAAGKGRAARPRTAAVTLPPESLSGPDPYQVQAIPPPHPVQPPRRNALLDIDEGTQRAAEAGRPALRPVDPWADLVPLNAPRRNTIRRTQ